MFYGYLHFLPEVASKIKVWKALLRKVVPWTKHCSRQVGLGPCSNRSVGAERRVWEALQWQVIPLAKSCLRQVGPPIHLDLLITKEICQCEFEP